MGDPILILKITAPGADARAMMILHPVFQRDLSRIRGMHGCMPRRESETWQAYPLRDWSVMCKSMIIFYALTGAGNSSSGGNC